jgi:hypothetical protein
MIVSKNNETARVVSGFYQGYKLAGIWNKGVYIPFASEEENLFSTVKGYIVLTDGESPGYGTPVFDGIKATDEQLIAGVKNVISNYEVVKMKKPFEAEVVFNESDVPFTDNAENEFPFAFFAIEKAALPDGKNIVPKIINPVANEIVASSYYKVAELNVDYDGETVEYYVVYNSANLAGDNQILYPTAE